MEANIPSFGLLIESQTGQTGQSLDLWKEWPLAQVLSILRDLIIRVLTQLIVGN